MPSLVGLGCGWTLAIALPWWQHHKYHPGYYYYYFFMSRYSAPEDLEITNKEKKNYNGCNGLVGSERVLKWDRVPPLQCYGHLLVACDVCRPSSDLLDQFDGLMVPGSGRFDDHWVKNVGTGETAVLAGLIGSCVFCSRFIIIISLFLNGSPKFSRNRYT